MFVANNCIIELQIKEEMSRRNEQIEWKKKKKKRAKKSMWRQSIVPIKIISNVL